MSSDSKADDKAQHEADKRAAAEQDKNKHGANGRAPRDQAGRK